MRHLLTDDFIRKLAPPVKGRLRCWDTKQTAFAVVVTPGGHKALYTAGRLAGKLIWVKLANFGDITLTEARNMAKAAQVQMRLGNHPKPKAEPKEAKGPAVQTFRQVAIQYREDKVAHLRSWRKYSARLDVLIAEWGTRPITEISRRDVIDLLLATKKARGDNMARHLIWECAAPLFAWAEARLLVPVSPMHGMKPLDLLARRPERDRVLDEAEMRAIWKACAQEDAPRPFATIVRLLMLTGLRRQEVADLKWSEIRWGDRPMLVLPASRMKMQKEHQVPLCPVAAALIHAVPRRLGDDRLFPRISFGQKTGWLEGTCGSSDFVLHDIRRSCRTFWAELGIQDHVAERLLAHSTQSGVAKVYNRHGYQEEMRRALLAWEAKLTEILSENYARLAK
jgi:integrase